MYNVPQSWRCSVSIQWVTGRRSTATDGNIAEKCGEISAENQMQCKQYSGDDVDRSRGHPHRQLPLTNTDQTHVT